MPTIFALKGFRAGVQRDQRFTPQYSELLRAWSTVNNGQQVARNSSRGCKLEKQTCFVVFLFILITTFNAVTVI